MAKFTGHDLFGSLGGRFIGEMAVAAKDALFEAPRPMWAILKQFDIMIGFENQDIGGTNSFKHQPRGMSKIGQEPDIALASSEQEPNRVLRVMWHTKGFNRHIFNVKSGSCRKQAAVQLGPLLVFDRLARWTITVDGYSQLFDQLPQALNVVGMFVGNENASEILRGPSDRRKAFADLAQAKARIDENPCLIGLQIGAVSGRTASQNRQTNRHGQP